MSLGRQIVTLMDLCTTPVSVRTLVAQIEALGGDATAESVNKRLHQMKAAGQARKEPAGWTLVDGGPLRALRAKWQREGQPAPVITQAPAVEPDAPTLRERIVQALKDRPGSTAKELSATLGAVAKNEPANTLSILSRQARVRHEGEWPARRYFACEDSQRKVLPRAGKRKAKAADSNPIKPADSAADAGARVDPDRLLAEAEWLLRKLGTWCFPSFLATAMEADRNAVAACLEQLVQSGRAVSRFWSLLKRTKQYAHIDVHRPLTIDQAAAATQPTDTAGATSAPAAAETGPLEDSRDRFCRDDAGVDGLLRLLRGIADRDVTAVEVPTPEPAAEAPPAAIPDAVVDAALTLGLVQSDMHQLAEDARIPGEIVQLVQPRAVAATTLPHLVEGIATDLEDTIGRACDERADHRAIKALALAAGALRRAQIDLLRAA